MKEQGNSFGKSKALKLINILNGVILILLALLLIKSPKFVLSSFVNRLKSNKTFLDNWFGGFGASLIETLILNVHYLTVTIGLVILNVSAGVISEKILAYKILIGIILAKSIFINNPLLSTDNILYKKDLHQLALDFTVILFIFYIMPTSLNKIDVCKCSHKNEKSQNSESIESSSKQKLIKENKMSQDENSKNKEKIE